MILLKLQLLTLLLPQADMLYELLRIEQSC